MIQCFLSTMARSTPTRATRKRLAAVTLLGLLGSPSLSVGQTADQTSNSEVRKYCTNIAAAASDARFAWQTGKLNELEVRIKTRIRDLDAKAAELRAWIERREAVEKKAAEKLVGIYSKMRPETAAMQITMLDDAMAAAVLAQLNPRQASAIFNEIVPERAGKLASLIAGVTPTSDKKL